jgi:hypothetical protein
VVGIAYAFLTGTYQPLGIEPMGFPALLMAGALSLLVALTLTIFSRTYPDRAEEEPDAAVESETGVQGSFAPYSWYPLWTAIGACMAFVGVAAGWWILALGVPFVLIGVVGWVMEFSRGQHAH